MAAAWMCVDLVVEGAGVQTDDDCSWWFGELLEVGRMISSVHWPAASQGQEAPLLEHLLDHKTSAPDPSNSSIFIRHSFTNIARKRKALD